MKSKLLTASTRALFAASVLSAASASAQASGYGGVAPGSDTVPETVTAKPGADRVVTWPGFQMLPDGSSRVFVQTTIEVTPELKRSGNGYMVIVPGVVLAQGNAKLPLDTQYFNTPVKNVRAKELKGRGVSIVLEMRAQVKPTLRTEKAPNGFFFVLIEFPPGNYK